MKVYTFREDDDNLYVKNPDENNKPIGAELAISWDDWDKLENKKRLAKNIWSFDIPDEIKKRVDRDVERLKWLTEPERIVMLLMVFNKPQESDLHTILQLGEISQEYLTRFPQDNQFDFVRYTRLAIAQVKALLAG